MTKILSIVEEKISAFEKSIQTARDNKINTQNWERELEDLKEERKEYVLWLQSKGEDFYFEYSPDDLSFFKLLHDLKNQPPEEKITNSLF